MKQLLYAVILAASVTGNIVAGEAWYQSEKHLLAWQQAALEQDAVMVLEGQLMRDIQDLTDRCIDSTTAVRKPD